MAVFSSENSKILEGFSIFLGGGDFSTLILYIIWLDIVLSTSFCGGFRATFRIKITIVIDQKFEIMLDIIAAFWEIWLDIVLITSFFGAFRAHFRIKITIVISQKNRNNDWYYIRILGDPPHRKIEKTLGICKCSQENTAIFRVKKTIVNPLIFFIFGRNFDRVSLENDQKFDSFVIFSNLPYTDDFFGLIFDFFPKKTDFLGKKFKNTESPKMVSKRL